jgi:hypothetical protein
MASALCGTNAVHGLDTDRMAQTNAAELRRRILLTALELPLEDLTRARVLAHMEAQYKWAWTAEDNQTPPSRPFETKWRNNASYERANMVRDGLLQPGGGGNWSLTEQGRAEAEAIRS